MLFIARSLWELDFGKLMAVYAQSNMENGEELWSDLPRGQQLLRVEQDFYQYLKECFFSAEGAYYAVWTDASVYVSALRLEPYQDGLLLEALETAPDHRRKGYANALVSAVLERVGETKVYSHVSKRNTASLRVHEKCGFYRILDHAVYADGSVLTNSCTFCNKA